MRHRFQGALTLLKNDSIDQLIQRFLTLHHSRQRVSALIVAMFNADERRLTCYRQPDTRQQTQLQLDTDIEDINHPLVQVLRTGQPMVWEALSQGVRIENEALRNFIQQLPNECGLFALPLFDFQHRACGVIAVFAENVARIADVNGMFGVYCEVFQHQLCQLQERLQLQTQSGQIRALLKAHQQREKQLDELFATIAASESQAAAGLSHDYSQINDLNDAVAAYECAVLRQRHHQCGGNLSRMADSLDLPLRTLKYKLAKHRSRL